MTRHDGNTGPEHAHPMCPSAEGCKLCNCCCCCQFVTDPRPAPPNPDREDRSLLRENSVGGENAHDSLINRPYTQSEQLLLCSSHLCHKKTTVRMDTRPSPDQVESEQRGTRPESTESGRSESDLFSGSAKKSGSYQTSQTFSVPVSVCMLHFTAIHVNGSATSHPLSRFHPQQRIMLSKL